MIKKILAISGSLRKDSYNTSLLDSAKELAPKNMDIEVYIPSTLPIFSQDLEDNMPKAALVFKNKIETSDGIIFASPEHNFTISAAMKNAIEWGNRPWGDNSYFNKPAAIMGASTSRFGTLRAQDHLRQIFQDLSVVTFNWPTVMVAEANDKFKDGKLTDEREMEKVIQSLKHLSKLIDILPKKDLVFTTK